MNMLKILIVFTLGSVAGLVTFSHVLSYILKRYKNITIASIIGFIVGSLGVVWPWKKTIYALTVDGDILYDSTGRKIITNYQRFIPDLSTETYMAIFYIFVGIAIVLTLEWYGKRTRKIKA